MEAVNRVVAAHGVAGATVARIAATAGVSEGTLYVYFASREDMLMAALDSLFAQMADLIDGAPEGTVPEVLRDIARRHSHMMKTAGEGFTAPWIEFIAAGSHAGLREAIAQTQTKAFSKMMSIIERGQAEGTIREDVDARRLTWQWYTVVWAENLSSLMGLSEYIDQGHSAYSLELMLRESAVTVPEREANGPSQTPKRGDAVHDYRLIGQGRREIRFAIPEGWRVTTYAELEAEGLEVSIPDLVRRAIERPVGAKPLAELVQGKERIAIVVDDLTRPTPRRPMLEALLEFLGEHGVDDAQIDVLIGGGTHRLLSQAEIDGAFGEELCRRLRIVNHDCHAPDLVCVGTLPHSGEVFVNALFAGADLRITLGSILPHPWNGFGGGAKLVLPGVAGWDTIKRHHLALVTAKGVSYGNLADNPFHDEVHQAGRMAGLDFIVNALYNANEDVKGIVAGDLEEAYRFGADLCRKEIGIEFLEAADVTITSAFPYCEAPQTMKPLGIATLVTKKGGTVILYADEVLGGCYPESMLAAFGHALDLAAGDPKGLVRDYLSRGELISPDAPMDVNSAINTTLLFLSRVKVILVTKDADERQAASLGFEYAATLDDAVARVAGKSPQATVNVLPAGGLVLPLVAEDMKFEY